MRLIGRASQAGAEFTVRDTGVGVEPQQVARLTERLCRVDRGRPRETGGPGLGLASAKHALMRYQATLDIRSEPGKGSRFTARLPERRAFLSVTRAQDAATARIRGSANQLVAAGTLVATLLDLSDARSLPSYPRSARPGFRSRSDSCLMACGRARGASDGCWRP